MTKVGRITLEHTVVDGTEWWEDNYGNIWHAATFTRVQAMRASKSLIDCTGCEDCTNCKECKDCQRCTDCIRCDDCSDCVDCRYSTRLYDCKVCSTCCDLYECVERIGVNGDEN